MFFPSVRHFSKWVGPLFLVLALIFSPAARASDRIKATKGGTYYTLFSLYYEDDHHYTTNYRKGIFLPINTPVQFLKADDEEILISISGKKVRFINVPEYSGEDMEGIFARTFAESPVALDSFSDVEKENIAAGTVVEGMSKKAVILALGYPPKHQTPTLASPQWRYWHNRFGTFIVHFKGDLVSRIQE
jgi:hypothetical protein